MDSRIPINTIIQGDCRELLKQFPDESIDFCMTSPPYWALRDYGLEPQIWEEEIECEHVWQAEGIRKQRGSPFGSNSQTKHTYAKALGVEIRQGSFCRKCGAWRGSLGLEPTFDLYLKHLCDVFDEVKRVLKRSGSCWVNLGDTYAGSGCGTNDYRTESSRSIQGKGKGAALYGTGGIAQKISAVPHKSLCLIPFRFAIEMLNRGWILRNVIVWHKPNCLPQSVRDRFTVDFEHLFFFVKQGRYYFEQQFEPLSMATIDRVERFVRNNEHYDPRKHKTLPDSSRSPYAVLERISRKGLNPMGRNRRAVWSISTQPFRGPHFAVYPEALCEIPIRSGCPPNGIVLDIFAGSGTTLAVAKSLGRRWLGCDLNPNYVDMATRRLEAGVTVTEATSAYPLHRA